MKNSAMTSPSINNDSHELNLSQVAKHLGISLKTALKWVREGQIRGKKKINGHWSVDTEELRRFINERLETQ